jgi:hypothetical protein
MPRRSARTAAGRSSARARTAAFRVGRAWMPYWTSGGWTRHTSSSRPRKARTSNQTGPRRRGGEGRFADLLDEDPGVEADLRTVVEEIAAELPAGWCPRGGVRGRSLGGGRAGCEHHRTRRQDRRGGDPRERGARVLGLGRLPHFLRLGVCDSVLAAADLSSGVASGSGSVRPAAEAASGPVCLEFFGIVLTSSSVVVFRPGRWCHTGSNTAHGHLVQAASKARPPTRSGFRRFPMPLQATSH